MSHSYFDTQALGHSMGLQNLKLYILGKIINNTH